MIIRGAAAEQPKNTKSEARKELYFGLSRPGVKVTKIEVRQPRPNVKKQALRYPRKR